MLQGIQTLEDPLQDIWLVPIFFGPARVTRRSKSDGSVSSNDRLAPNWQLLRRPQSRGRPLISGFLLRELPKMMSSKFWNSFSPSNAVHNTSDRSEGFTWIVHHNKYPNRECVYLDQQWEFHVSCHSWRSHWVPFNINPSAAVAAPNFFLSPPFIVVPREGEGENKHTRRKFLFKGVEVAQIKFSRNQLAKKVKVAYIKW